MTVEIPRTPVGLMAVNLARMALCSSGVGSSYGGPG